MKVFHLSPVSSCSNISQQEGGFLVGGEFPLLKAEEDCSFTITSQQDRICPGFFMATNSPGGTSHS